MLNVGWEIWYWRCVFVQSWPWWNAREANESEETNAQRRRDLLMQRESRDWWKADNVFQETIEFPRVSSREGSIGSRSSCDSQEQKLIYLQWVLLFAWWV